MNILAIILLIIIGIALIILEILVIPGAIAGIIGFGLLIGGIYFAYATYGILAGNITLVSVLVLSVIAVVMAFKSKTWRKAMLSTNIDSKVDVFNEVSFKPGDSGITISRLAPMGKVKVNNHIIEAKSENVFINPNTEIEVIKVLDNMLVVKIK